MKYHRQTLIIDGIDHYAGAEIARFGRAMGHRIIGLVDGSPPHPDEFEHPWMHGVIWLGNLEALADSSFVEAPRALILFRHSLYNGTAHRFQATHIERLQSLLQLSHTWPTDPHIVFRSTIAQPLLPRGYTESLHRAETLLAPYQNRLTILRTPLLYGPDRPDSVLAFSLARLINRLPFAPPLIPSPLPVETTALAALRAALEPHPPSLLNPSEIASYGDVMIPS